MSCKPVPERRLGEPLDVTFEEEKFGAAYRVDGRSIAGVDSDERFAVSFAQDHCGRDGWFTAHTPPWL